MLLNALMVYSTSKNQDEIIISAELIPTDRIRGFSPEAVALSRLKPLQKNYPYFTIKKWRKWRL